MDFQYSDLVDPATYSTEGLCDGIPLRLHKDIQYEINGSLNAQQDWETHVAKLNGFHGGLGTKLSFMSVTVPECKPERLEVISYANEFAFLYDDVMEEMDFEKASSGGDSFLEVFGKEALSVQVTETARGEKKMQARILGEMLSIDRERAINTMKAWSTFVRQAASHHRDTPFTSLDEYLPFRILDAGEMIWYGTVTFAMGLTIPASEWDLCRKLVHPAFAAISLTNDLFSWEKEAAAAKRRGSKCVVNAIWVIMEEMSISEEEAKLLCREKIKAYTMESRQTTAEIRDNTVISADLKVYVEAIQYSLVGNLVWSTCCPRYHV